ncbi:hypothetical protein WN943_004798 [Citrus x changshan-huyou]
MKRDAVVEEEEHQQCAICLNEFEDFDNDATLLNCGCQQLLSQCLYLGVACPHTLMDIKWGPDFDVQFPSKEFRFQMHRFGPIPSSGSLFNVKPFRLGAKDNDYSFFKTEPVPHKLQLQDALANAIANNDSNTIQICVVLTIQGVNHVVKEDEECVICLKKFENIDNEATLLNCQCQFLYHHDCIWRWLRELKNYSSPICRTNFARGTQHFAQTPCKRRKLLSE